MYGQIIRFFRKRTAVSLQHLTQLFSHIRSSTYVSSKQRSISLPTVQWSKCLKNRCIKLKVCGRLGGHPYVVLRTTHWLTTVQSLLHFVHYHLCEALPNTLNAPKMNHHSLFSFATALVYNFSIALIMLTNFCLSLQLHLRSADTFFLIYLWVIWF